MQWNRGGRRAARMFAIGAVLVAVATAGSVLPVSAQRPAQSGGSGSGSGTLRLSAQEEPFCADWIASCAGLSWGNWTLGVSTLPQAFRVNPAGEYVPGPVLSGAPTIEPGPPVKVTYPINPAAVWSDGTPITSADFEYTWQQIVTGKDIYDATGYTSIEAIDTSDPKTAVVTFSEPFAGWRDLFGGFYYILPSHILEGQNRHKAMKDGYAFSGGPWLLDGGAKGWDKGRSITLVPNPKWWGTKPSIAKVVFQFIPESAAETQALKTGQVSAAYPIPQTGVLDEIEEAGLQYEVGYGNTFEGFWFNNLAAPLDSTAVRQALLYATDRQAIVDQIIKPAIDQGRVLQSYVVPTFPEYYTPAFNTYTRDLGKVEELMTGDGWTKGSDGIWEKNGEKASLTVSTTSGNEGRELTQQLWQSQLEQAGFDLQIKNASADLLFGKHLPRGRYSVALYASVGTPDPGLCIIFCSKNIPTRANGLVGQNYSRVKSPTIDAPWTAVDREVDPSLRAASAKQGQAALAAEAVSIPLYQLPTLFIWDPDRIGGPLQDNVTEGPFFNMELWTLK